MKTSDPVPVTAPDRRPSAARPEIITRLRGGLVVSCQARDDEPLHGPAHMAAMARSVLAGGAVGLRVEGLADIGAVAAVSSVPVMGLWKVGRGDDVFITPTLAHAVEVREAGADLVAVDATGRARPDGSDLAAIVRAVHERGGLIVADVSTYDEGLAAADAGADLVATTLAGYTPHTRSADPAPALDLVARLAAGLAVPLVAEGRVRTPEQARRAVDLGAWCVVVGTAITRPASIAAGFAAALAAGEVEQP